MPPKRQPFIKALAAAFALSAAGPALTSTAEARLDPTLARHALQYTSPIEDILGIPEFEDKVIKADKLVFVVFYTEESMASMLFKSTLRKFARNNSDKYIFAKVNAKDNPDITRACHITRVPTVIAIAKGGYEAGRIEGAVGMQDLVDFTINAEIHAKLF